MIVLNELNHVDGSNEYSNIYSSFSVWYQKGEIVPFVTYTLSFHSVYNFFIDYPACFVTCKELPTQIMLPSLYYNSFCVCVDVCARQKFNQCVSNSCVSINLLLLQIFVLMDQEQYNMKFDYICHKKGPIG